MSENIGDGLTIGEQVRLLANGSTPGLDLSPCLIVCT
jgi:hypothetical protein